MSPKTPAIEVQATPGQALGMPPARFLRDYWQKRPLLIRQALPMPAPPLAPEDLAGLACEESALSRLVMHDRSADAWQVRQGPFAEAEFPSLPNRDWTLLVQDVDKWDGDVAALLPFFDFLPRWRIDDVMVSFAAPGGSVGAHVDQYDVFLLQGLGQRRWEIDAGPNPPLAFRDDVELKLLRAFSPTHRWDLAPGDMLYLPPGVPHHGVALDACLTFSVGMRAPAQSELLVDFADYLAERLPESARYADPDLTPAKASGEIDAAAIERLLQAMPWLRLSEGGAKAKSMAKGGRARAQSGGADVPSLSTLRTWFGCFITRYRSAGDVAAPPRLPSAVQIAARLEAGAALVRHPFARIAWSRAARGAELYVDGQAHRCSLATARCLGGSEPVDAERYASLDAAGRALLHALVARGCFALTRPARRRRA